MCARCCCLLVLVLGTCAGPPPPSHGMQVQVAWPQHASTSCGSSAWFTYAPVCCCPSLPHEVCAMPWACPFYPCVTHCVPPTPRTAQDEASCTKTSAFLCHHCRCYPVSLSTGCCMRRTPCAAWGVAAWGAAAVLACTRIGRSHSCMDGCWLHGCMDACSKHATGRCTEACMTSSSCAGHRAESQRSAATPRGPTADDLRAPAMTLHGHR